MQIDIIGVPIDLGADRRGVDMGPSAIRYSSLRQRLESLGHTVEDKGNVEVAIQETCSITDPKLKYIDCIVPMSRRVAGAVATSMQSGCFPLVLGGDHSLSIGSVRGAATRSLLRRMVAGGCSHSIVAGNRRRPAGIRERETARRGGAAATDRVLELYQG